MNNCLWKKGSYRIMLNEIRKITVVTGERGAGKTTYCLEQVQAARESGWVVRGILSPAIYDAGRKTGFYLRNLENDEQRLSGTLNPEINLGGQFRCWSISTSVYEWGNQILSAIAACDLIVIDELGPLEFEEGKGYTAAFDCLKNADFQQALVVIRPECIANFQAMGFDFDTVKIIKE